MMDVESPPAIVIDTDDMARKIATLRKRIKSDREILRAMMRVHKILTPRKARSL